MKTKTLERIEVAINDCLDKAEGCTIDSDDEEFKFYDRVERMAKVLNESKKMDLDTELKSKEIELELKKLETERERLKAEHSINNPRLWIEGLVIPTALLMLKFGMLSVMAINATKFEQQDMATLSISKGWTRFVVDGIASLGRDR